MQNLDAFHQALAEIPTAAYLSFDTRSTPGFHEGTIHAELHRVLKTAGIDLVSVTFGRDDSAPVWILTMKLPELTTVYFRFPRGTLPSSGDTVRWLCVRAESCVRTRRFDPVPDKVGVYWDCEP